MNIWIVTTGNSDVQLTTEAHWLTLYDKVTESLNYLDFFPTPSDFEDEDIYTVPARALGIVYKHELRQYWSDLTFPLLDNFGKRLEAESILPDKIILLLTDQSILYPDYDSLKKSPCWKDTGTLWPILEHYFREKFPRAILEAVVLKPLNENGLDHWDSTLQLVQKELSQFKFKERETIYVSHQAGTPAVSSAVQFVTLANYGQKVKFLVGSEYVKESAEIIESSRYLRGISIQQAKSLVSTSPGAAKKLLEKIEDVNEGAIAELERKINLFNFNRVVNHNSDEFSLPAATQRIVDVLDLIGIFFEQENYLQGITLISTAQETFLRLAIVSKAETMTIVIGGKSYVAKEFFHWDKKGLHFHPQQHGLSKEAVCEKLLAPEKVKNSKYNSFQGLSNTVMLEWLKELEPAFKMFLLPKFEHWPLLEWYCEDYQERQKRAGYTGEEEIHLRHQLVHNLRGMERSDVNDFLMGYQPVKTDDVMKIYNEKVKQPFFEAIKLFKLEYTREKLAQELKKLADSLE